MRTVQALEERVVARDVAPQSDGPHGGLTQEVRRLCRRDERALVVRLEAVPTEHVAPRRVHEGDPPVLADGAHPFAEAAGDDREPLALLPHLCVELGVGQGDGAHRGQRLEQRAIGIVERFHRAPPRHAEPERAVCHLHGLGQGRGSRALLRHGGVRRTQQRLG